MANANRPSGLNPYSTLMGAAWNGQATMYYIASTDPNAYGIGDPLVLTGTADTAGVPGVTLATAGTGNPIVGSLLSTGGQTYGGSPITPSALDTMIIPATKTRAYYVLVADDASILFEIQEDSVGNNLAVTDVGSNFNLVSGTNNGYLSGWMLDSSTAATTSTLQVQVMRLSPRLDNAIGQYAKWIVRINNHQYRAGVTGI